MANSAKRNMWRERVERCLASGMSNKEWCELNRINHSTFYYWIAKFRKEEPTLFPTQNTSEWIEVTKEALAARVAMVPHSGKSQAPVGTNVYTKGNVTANTSTAHTTPVIHARINGVELSIAPGSNEVDIASVFKAARSL